MTDRHNNNKINKKYLATQWEMTKQPLNSIIAAILIVFTKGKEQNRTDVNKFNMYGLVRMLGKSTKIRSARVEPKRKERSFSTQLISQERVMLWRLTALREMDLSSFSAQMLGMATGRVRAGFFYTRT